MKNASTPGAHKREAESPTHRFEVSVYSSQGADVFDPQNRESTDLKSQRKKNHSRKTGSKIGASDRLSNI